MPLRIQQQLAELAQSWEPLEVGGVLAGYWHDDAAVITDWVGPGEGAEHQRLTFSPDQAFHVKEIARLFKASQGVTVYLGDWHTHPSGATRLSAMDKRTLRAIANHSDARCSRPLMVLLARNGDAWSTQVFTLGFEKRMFSPKVIRVELRVF